MKKTNFIEAVTERDVDLLVLEELHVSPNFQDWIVRLIYGSGYGPVRFDNAWHALSHPTLYESDLVFTFDHPNGYKCAVLIENKIDAPPQPEQATRYKARGEAGTEAGDWQKYKTCILAPQLYLSKITDANAYDVQIAYEAIKEWFQQRGTDDKRSQYKSRLIQEAIDQNRRGYTPKIDERVTRFWHSYWLFASREFPELSMKEPRDKPAGATWTEFRTKEFGQKRRIYHKLGDGIVDLEMDDMGDSVDKLKSTYAGSLGSDVEIMRAGRKASILIHVPRLDRFGEFDLQIDDVRKGLKAAYRLSYVSRFISGA